MNQSELVELVPQLVAKLEGASETDELLPGVLRFSTGTVQVVVSVHDDGQIRITAGLLMEVPYSGTTAMAINELNRTDLMFGRLFLVGNTESGVGAILCQEIVQGTAITWDHVPSIQAFHMVLGRIAFQCSSYVPRLGPSLGGRVTNADDAMFILAHA